MCDAVAQDVKAAINKVNSLRCRLIFIASPHVSEDIFVPNKLAARTGTDLVNVGTTVSRQLLEKTPRQRKLEADQILRHILCAEDSTCLLHRIDVLFEPSLELNPVQLLRKLSRHRTLVVVWGGVLQDGMLVYGEPGHPSHGRYPLDTARVVTVPSDQHR